MKKRKTRKNITKDNIEEAILDYLKHFWSKTYTFRMLLDSERREPNPVVMMALDNLLGSITEAMENIALGTLKKHQNPRFKKPRTYFEEVDRFDEKQKYRRFYSQDIVKMLNELQPLKAVTEIKSKEDRRTEYNKAVENYNLLEKVLYEMLSDERRRRDAKFNNLRKKVAKLKYKTENYIKKITTLF